MLTHHTTSLPARCSCGSRSRVHSRRRMMFRCAGYTRFGTARAGGEVTHPLQWSSEVHAPDLALIYYKTPDGCKGGWTCAKHAPGGRGAEGRLRVKTPDGCKGGWTCAKHAPGGRGAVGRVRINYRYYNPSDGRWTRRDSIGIEGGMSLHMITGNNPVSKVDQLGNLIAPPGMPSITRSIFFKTLIEIYIAMNRVKSKIDSMKACAEGVKADMLALNVKAREKDKYRHCYGTCLMRLRCGLTTQSLAAIWKEIDDIRKAIIGFRDFETKINFIERVLDSFYDFKADYSCPFESSEDDCLCCCNKK